jgi:formamidopyrimidine-DNA glycosylase
VPELPEVETVRRVMRRALGGKIVRKVEIPPDDILLSQVPPEPFVELLTGARVTDVGRKGKYWWIELDRRPWVFGHLGMTGWIRDLSARETRLREHGKAPLLDETGRPRFLKMLLEAEDGARIAFTDARRLGRLWLAESPEADARIGKLGPDAYDELPPPESFSAMLRRRKAPIKAVLMDQSFLAGLGNWLADETLYQAGIAPKRPAAEINEDEAARLHGAITDVLRHAVEVEADYERFPENWLFHHRWGGARGTELIEGRSILRETVGGRTTAWVPDVQK